MADQVLELLIRGRDQSNAAFASLDKNMKAAEAQQVKTAKAMEGGTEKAAKFADGLDRTTKKLAGLGEAAGLPADKLRLLSDVSDVAANGLEGLTKGTVGFNSASLGAAGAGLALGTAIGSWLNTFPAVQHAVDNLRDSIISLATGVEKTDEMAQAMHGIDDFQKRMAKSNDEAVTRQIASMKKAGKSIEEIAELYKKSDPAARTAIDRTIELGEAHKKAAAAAKEHAAETKRVEDAWKAIVKPFKELTQSGSKADLDVKLMAAFEALGPLSKASVTDVAAVADALRKMGQEGEQAARDLTDAFKAANGFSILGSGKGNLGGLLKDVPEFVPITKATRTVTLDLQFVEKETQDWRQELLGVADVFQQIGGSGGGLIGDVLSGVVNVSDSIKQWEKAGKGFGGTLAKIGAVGGILGTAFSVGKGIAGLFGDKEHMRVNDLRDEFIKSEGGLDALNKRAHEAGLTLDQLLNAKKVDDYNDAVKNLTDTFDLQKEAENKTLAAMQEFGISIDEMGPRFAQQQLDKQAATLFEKWELLRTAGADYNTLVEHMGPNLNAYVQDAIKAGATIPESFRPVIDQMIQHGELLDENGNAYKSTEEAGITFAQSMTEAMVAAGKATERLVKLLEQMLGLSGREVTIPVNFPTAGEGGQGGGRFRGGGEGMADGDRTITGWGVPAVLHGTSSNPEFVSRGDQIRDHLRAVIAEGGGYNASGPIYVKTGDTYLDGQMVARGVMRRMDAGKARSKQPLRRGR